MITFFSTLAFLLVVIGLRGIKYHYAYGQKIILLAQVAWCIVGVMQGNWLLVVQGVYLFWVAWTTDRLWSDKGYYK